MLTQDPSLHMSAFQQLAHQHNPTYGLGGPLRHDSSTTIWTFNGAHNNTSETYSR
jgi:hypothetical protein